MRACDVALEMLVRFIAVACLFSSGCVVPYAYPHLCCVPAVGTGPRHDEVHAFRVDVTGDILDAGESDDYVLTPVALSPGGRAPVQARLALDYGYYVIGIAINYPVHHGHSTLLRLYQPGYGLVEVCAWEMPAKVEWWPAQDLEAQEKAVDGLLQAPSISGPRMEFTYGYDKGPPFRKEQSNVHSLCPGSVAPGHREALFFAASEYERLTGLLSAKEKDGQSRKDRLLRKAHELRKRAAD
ncbi:MAG TPA: hypothetical protein VG013_30240 [Gemmataceae bacterium]|jgi:hypothetical protein|nr:hypothetical protein [Gemmataceae bacterium]